jgi:hypothetical protein
VQATAVSGVFDGFQMTGLPHTRLIAAFHDQTATGKLKADHGDGPDGVPDPIRRCPGRSDAMVRP